MGQTKLLSTNQLEQAFETFNQVSHKLDNSYRELECQVAGLSRELMSAKSARLKELSEKERLANRLSSLVAVLPGGVLIVDSRQVIRDANPEAVELLGDALTGELWSDVLLRVSGNSEIKSRELILNNSRRVSVVSRPLDVTGDHVVLITDVSEIHQLQEQLSRKKRLTALGEMAARLAHQIRTPLSTTTLYLSQLGRQDLRHEQRHIISAKVSDRLNHMGKLVDSMLSFVRGEKPATKIIYLHEVLESFESTVLPHLESSGSSIAVPHVDNTLKLVGDQEELVGALSNIAMNAMQAANGSVVLSLWVGALNNEWLQIIVRDNGPGISKKVIDRIFDPFFTTRSQGLGLGLAVVAMTISNHGGEIFAQNRPEGGAEFMINLPIANETAISTMVTQKINGNEEIEDESPE